MAEYSWMTPQNDEWYRMLNINLFASQTEVYEWLQTIDGEIITGRTLTVDDTTAFLRSYQVKTERDFERIMDEKNERGVLDLDNIHRHCERHNLKYTIEGPKLGTARRKYNEEQAQAEQALKEELRRTYREGMRYLRGVDGHERDVPRGLALLEDAAYKGFDYAYGSLSAYYRSKNMYGKAIRKASAGARNEDPMSMHVLSLLYRDGADFKHLSDTLTGTPDMKKTVNWCLKAALAGFLPAMRDVNRYIHEGLLVPDTKLYLELLVLQAKYNSFHQLNILINENI